MLVGGVNGREGGTVSQDLVTVSGTTGSPFVDAVRALHGGALAARLDEAIRELVLAVQTAEAKGSITLTIAIRPFAKRNAETLVVDGDYKIRAPVAASGGDIFFAAPDHSLTRHDPRQPELAGLREPAPVVPLRAAGSLVGSDRG